MDNDLLALLNRGVDEATNGNKSRARSFFQQALNLDPDSETAFLWLAWLTDDAYEAVELLEQVLTRNPKNDVARAYLEQARARREELNSLVSNSNTFNIWNKMTPEHRAQMKDSVIPYFGEFLLQQGIITRQQLESALKKHQELAQKGKPKLVGQVLVELGYLTQTQLETGLKKHQAE